MKYRQSLLKREECSFSFFCINNAKRKKIDTSFKPCYKSLHLRPIIWNPIKKPYLCNVFFIVLDLRLTKDWLSGIDSLFLCPYASIKKMLHYVLHDRMIRLTELCHIYFFMHDITVMQLFFLHLHPLKENKPHQAEKHEEDITRQAHHPLPPLEQEILRCICQHRAMRHDRLPA